MPHTIIGKDKMLFVVFSSWRPAEKLEAKYYEFKNILTEVYPDCHKIFLLDKKNRWFINGVDDSFNSIGKILKYINEYVKTYKLTDINFLGSSMGGFGALLYR